MEFWTYKRVHYDTITAEISTTFLWYLMNFDRPKNNNSTIYINIHQILVKRYPFPGATDGHTQVNVRRTLAILGSYHKETQAQGTLLIFPYCAVYPIKHTYGIDMFCFVVVILWVLAWQIKMIHLTIFLRVASLALEQLFHAKTWQSALCESRNWWLSARLQYLQCISNGDAAVLQ